MSLPTESPTRHPDRPPVPESPRARRHRAALWKDPRLVVGVALVAVSGLLGATLLGDGDDAVPVWAARTDLAAGQRVTAADLVVREVTFPDQQAADRYLGSDTLPPEGAVLVRAVGRGELLPRTATSAGKAPDLAEVPLSVPADGVPATVRPGSVVDVWVTPDPDAAAAASAGSEGTDGPESSLVFAGVRVLAVSGDSAGLGPATSRQVIVGIEPGQQDALPTALARTARGSVVLVRRP